MSGVTIPDKPAFKAGEVCELAQIQPYVLRSWESEFPDLGLSKTPGGPRIYRRVDVERVLRIRDMVFTEGLTLSGVRRRFEAEQPEPQDDLFTLVAEVEAARAARATQAEPAVPVTKTRSAARAAAPVADAAPAADVAEPPVPAAAVSPDAVPAPMADEARAQIGKLKDEMRSLLALLGGDEEPAARTGASRKRQAK